MCWAHGGSAGTSAATLRGLSVVQTNQAAYRAAGTPVLYKLVIVFTTQAMIQPHDITVKDQGHWLYVRHHPCTVTNTSSWQQ